MSYLTGRSATVRVGSLSSSTVGVPHGVPQGSILGLLLYTVYVAPIGRLIHNLGVTYHQYADDTHVYTKHEVPATSSLASLQQCVSVLHAWFSQKALLLNTEKSAVIYFGTRQRLRVSKLPESVIIGGSIVTTNDELKILGVVLDSSLTFDKHVQNTVRNRNFHLRALRHIRSSLTQDVASMMASSIIGSRIDYCNSLLIGISEQNLDRLQRLQSKAARRVCSAGRQVTSSDVL